MSKLEKVENRIKKLIKDNNPIKNDYVIFFQIKMVWYAQLSLLIASVPRDDPPEDWHEMQLLFFF